MAERIDFEFVGTVSHKLDLDPKEFEGKRLDAIAAEIRGVLASIAPNVSFFEDDIVLAADIIAKV